ncbi:tRNA pseudouridine synthase A [Methylophaga frappieri]|uniref:tRNA pseudouridine synthase A n=1 Tax=Methylophaga frappieri (strain ATCC BAA-2434 / DSM 25690 / JAM7) TaxID=754477 RepID=I1YL52_METFJ|nr:tRNA pseudouridine synthase A [Methylophaga frappieri]
MQQSLQQAVSVVADADITVSAAGRTDAGVHALNQVVHFDTQARRADRNWLLGINTNLPDDIAVNWVKAVDTQFHARFSATKRRYRYLVLNRLCRSALHHQRMWWFYKPLDIARMQQAASLMLGQHDFSALRAKECQAKSPIKTLDQIQIIRRGDCIAVDVEARSFLHHMVRNIMGVLMAVGEGKYPPEWVNTVLASRNRDAAGVTAPPEGLFLTEVCYPPEYSLPTVSAFPVLW